jgi:hypothetical protein
VRIKRWGKNESFRKIYTLSIQRGGYLVGLFKRILACRDGDGKL